MLNVGLMQVWFKNRRAKVRQQSAQGKPIVTNSETETKSPKMKKTPPSAQAAARDSITPPSAQLPAVKSEARSPLTAAADSSSSRLSSGSLAGLAAPSYPSPAITPGSSHGSDPAAGGAGSGYTAPVSSVSQFWSPITPPDGIDSGLASSSAGDSSGSLLRQPPTLVQMQVKAANVSPPPAGSSSALCSNPPYSNYSHYSSVPYNTMDLYNFPPSHSMAQPPNYSSHYMSGSNFFRPPSLSSANTMAEYETYNEKYQVGV